MIFYICAKINEKFNNILFHCSLFKFIYNLFHCSLFKFITIYFIVFYCKFDKYMQTKNLRKVAKSLGRTLTNGQLETMITSCEFFDTLVLELK